MRGIPSSAILQQVCALGYLLCDSQRSSKFWMSFGHMGGFSVHQQHQHIWGGFWNSFMLYFSYWKISDLQAHIAPPSGLVGLIYFCRFFAGQDVSSSSSHIRLKATAGSSGLHTAWSVDGRDIMPRKTWLYPTPTCRWPWLNHVFISDYRLIFVSVLNHHARVGAVHAVWKRDKLEFEWNCFQRGKIRHFRLYAMYATCQMFY